MSDRSRWYLIWIIAILPLIGWWTTGLFDLDEGFYGAVTAEMNRRGEWITPYFNGQPWFEKPILVYWLGKPSLWLFGPDFGPRFPSVLCAIATLAIVAWFAKRHFSDAVAQMAILILGSSLLFVAIGRMMMTDMPLVLCLTAAFCTFWESLGGSSRWRIWTGLALGIGVLAKGPVALLLFGIVMVWMFSRHKELRPKFRGSWLPAFAAMVAAISTWYLPAYLVNGQTFVQKFLIEQNLGRFSGGDAAHTLDGPKNYFFFVPFLLLGMLPWSLWIPKVFRSREGIDPELRSWLITWAVTVFVFFTISGAKLMHYIVPMFPAVALLVAAQLHTGRARKGAIAWTFAIAVIANVGFPLWYQSTSQNEAHALTRYVRDHAAGNRVAFYQLTRRGESRGTGGLQLQETSLPSLMLYLNGTAEDTDNLDQLITGPKPVWIITRDDRIDEAAMERVRR
ncbi:MAG TPA: glycosyltransferase family 39 protein, partial [Roseimicrobium sp.]|nr:glycosyltransferase family 39 protein [Roseimicrobium sp.]